MSSTYVTAIPRVTSSEPDLSQKDYTGPVTRSIRRRKGSQSLGDLESLEMCSRHRRNQIEDADEASNPKHSIIESGNESKIAHRPDSSSESIINASLDSPKSDQKQTPSPLHKTPPHGSGESFVTRHEVPRKLLHVSIGIFSVFFYTAGIQTTAITPWLMYSLFPITVVDVLRLNNESLNKIYVRILGTLMRKSEHQCFNGVIWYLLGTWFVLTTFPKDIGLMGILLLSWCDTAASTVGRAFGHHTPSIRKGKSFAGSAAAFVVGVACAAAFWGWLAPRSGPFPGDENFPFMFTGKIQLPTIIREKLGLTTTQTSVEGMPALGIMSIWTGFVASVSEAASFFGLDDNLTIPVLSGIGMWGFLKVFG